MTDISARMEAEEKAGPLNAELEERVQERTTQLKESQRLYSIIARNFPNGSINVFDREYNYVLVEGKELYKMGVTSEMLTGPITWLSSILRSANIFREHLEPVFDGKNSSFEVTYKGNTYELNATGLADNGNGIQQILVVEHNISHKKKAEAQIYEALEKERELNEWLSIFS